MFFVPQATAAFGVAPAGLSIVSFDAWGQPMVQQPLQVFGVLPQFAFAGMSGVTGFAKGIAGIVLGGGAAINGNNGGTRARRSRRQPKREQHDPSAVNSEEFQDALEEPSENCEDLVTQSGRNVEEPSEKLEDAVAFPPTQDASEENSEELKKLMAKISEGGGPQWAAPQETKDKSAELKQLMAKLEEGGESRASVMAAIRGSMLDLSLDALGCRLIQHALDNCSQKDAAELAQELRGHIPKAIESKSGNYVVQKIVEVLPTSIASFVVEELQDIAPDMARHRYGCRILCRLLEHSATEAGTAYLVERLLADTRELSRHAYGHHVLRCILEHGSPEDRLRIATSLCGGLQRHAKHRHASFVVEKALAHCEAQGQEALANELLQRPETIVDLARHQFGRHVVSQLARIPGPCSERALYNLSMGLPQVQSSKHGRRLIGNLKQQLTSSAVW